MIILIKKILYAYQLEMIFLVFTLVHFCHEYTFHTLTYVHKRTYVRPNARTHERSHAYAHKHNLHTQVEKDIRPEANLAFTYFYVRLNLSVRNLMLR